MDILLLFRVLGEKASLYGDTNVPTAECACSFEDTSSWQGARI